MKMNETKLKRNVTTEEIKYEIHGTMQTMTIHPPSDKEVEAVAVCHAPFVCYWISHS